MKAILSSLLFAATMVDGASPAFGANVVAARWRSSSRLTPAEAVAVLYLEASGASVSSEDLFEAEKHLRSDGPVSPNEYVVTEVFTRLLRRELSASSSALRVEPPLLHWLESRVSPSGVELRGESLQLAVSYGNATAIVRLRHRTLHHVWEDCGGELCLTTLHEPLRSDVSYVWSAVPGAALDAQPPLPPACAPPPAPAATPAKAPFTFRHVARQLLPDETHDLSCVFRASPKASLRVTYAAGGTVAFAPARAAASAVVNNPLELRLFE